MTGLLVTIHVLACVVLIILVLIQRGRGAGLVESFAGVESMFGTKTSAFLTKTTTVMSVIFFITCLSLAVLSVKQSKSLMRNVKAQAATAKVEEKTDAVKTDVVKTEATKTDAVTSAALPAVAVPIENVKPQGADVK